MYNFSTRFLLRNPEISNLISDEIISPFSYYVWYLMVATTIVISLTIKLTYIVEHMYINHTVNFSPITTFLMVIAGFTQQGIYVIPDLLSGKIIIMSLLILALMIYNYYTSSFVGLLLNKQPNLWSTIQEFIKSKESRELYVAMENQSYILAYLLETKNEYDILLNNTKLTTNGEFNLMSVEEALPKLREGKFAYYCELYKIYPLIATNFSLRTICELAEIPLIPPGHMSLMLVKNSEYRKMFQIRYFAHH